MAYPKKITFDTLRSAAFGAIGAAYAAVGDAFARPPRIIKISNATDADVFFSLDGTNDHDYISANGFVLYDLTANKVRDDGAFLAQGQNVYLKRVSGAPTSGAVYITVMGASQ